jgi:hypothetical protein
MPYGYNIDIQSLKIGFYKGESNIIALAESGNYNKYYSRCKVYVTFILLLIFSFPFL